ncbi:alanine racemase [Streptomonospora sp. S1-112]|uniref:Alanine racemase n=1 Tax=Streptomonospora mangrovi TaxID=2883123 RepID=A0A9X3NM50_9ACTN|nr:alanine racemase [Streptomonospora mangrovi]MDA0566272.1 alanine racemase [Streptomonospora mangrovi]
MNRPRSSTGPQPPSTPPSAATVSAPDSAPGSAPASALAGSGLPAHPLAALDAEPVEARSLPESPASPARVRAAGWGLADLWLPAVVLEEDALRHNLDRFARWCAEHGADLAPHGKTTMAPLLWSAQLDHGAWGLTAATVAQARVMRRFGARRIVIANEVTEPAQLAWLAHELADAAFQPLVLVDSAEGAARTAAGLAGAPRPLPVLVELGVPGRRAGARGVEAALEAARAAAASDALVLSGVEGFEGVFPQRRDDDSAARVRAWLAGFAEFVRRADAEGLFARAEEVVVTAGGSAFPDLAAAALADLPELSRPVRRVVRSGCYLTHDDLLMERASPLRSGAVPDPLRPALTCYARVLSCPEPGRVLLGAGKRDVSFDIDLPVVRAVLEGGAAGRRRPAGAGMRVVELNDHHAFLDVDPGTPAPRAGDVVELGLSHPCTVFDKWPLIPVVDSAGRVVDAVRTLF